MSAGVYLPQHFSMPTDEALDFAAGIGTGHLVTAGPNGLDATLLPFLLRRDREGVVVRAHLSAGNAQRVDVENGAQAMLIVQGPAAYVSPGLYPSKADHGRVVPTLNYVVIHLHGTLRPVSDPAALLQLVTDLTNHREHGSADPWSVDDAPTEFIHAQLRAIVGLELVVGSVEGKAKLSQNRPEVDRVSVRRAFMRGDADRQFLGGMMNEPGAG